VITPDQQTALPVIDLQKSLVASPFIHPLTEVIERKACLLEVFRRLELPMVLVFVLVNLSGGAPGRIEQPLNPIYLRRWTGLLPELGRQSGDIALTKRPWGALASTGLEVQLGAHGATRVVLAGAATGTGVEPRAHWHARRDSTLRWPRTP
jgi:nicotinamidase-related amidase